MSDLSYANTKKVTVRSAERPAEYVKIKKEEGILKKGWSDGIIKRHKTKQKLEDVNIPFSTIRQRVLQ